VIETPAGRSKVSFAVDRKSRLFPSAFSSRSA